MKLYTISKIKIIAKNCGVHESKPLVHVDISFFAANVSESSTNTFD
jgi:hypothetical protein